MLAGCARLGFMVSFVLMIPLYLQAENDEDGGKIERVRQRIRISILHNLMIAGDAISTLETKFHFVNYGGESNFTPNCRDDSPWPGGCLPTRLSVGQWLGDNRHSISAYQPGNKSS